MNLNASYRFGGLMAAALLAAACRSPQPTPATAYTALVPVNVGPVRTLGGQPTADWGKSLGRVEVDVSNNASNTGWTTTGPEYLGRRITEVGVKKQCPTCPVQVKELMVFAAAGAAADTTVRAKGHIRPAAPAAGTTAPAPAPTAPAPAEGGAP